MRILNRAPWKDACGTIVLALLILGGAPAAAGSASLPAPAQSPLPPGPEFFTLLPNTIALWQFDDNGGTTATDSSGNGRHGTLIGVPAWTSGVFGSALDFDGAFDYVGVAPIPLPADWTVQAYTRFPLNVTGNGYRTLIRFGDGLHHVLVDPSGNLGSYGNGMFSSGFNVNGLTGWHLVTAVGTGAVTHFYVDGNFVGTAGYKEANPVSSLGNAHSSSAQNWGVIDALRILSGARSAQEIASDVAASALWQFDENAGVSAADSSGSGHTGTLAGGAVWTAGQFGSAVDTSASGKVSLPNPVILGSSWTIQTWTRFPLAPTAIWNSLTSTTGQQYHIIAQSGVLGVYENGFITSGFDVTTVPAGWHLLTAVGSAGQTGFYIDANSVGTSAFKQSTPVVVLGNHTDGSEPWGAMDSMRILNTVRTPQQIGWDARGGALSLIPLRLGVNAGADVTVAPGANTNFSVAIDEPGETTWTVQIDYGDGTPVQGFPGATQPFAHAHVYAASGTYTMLVTVTDAFGNVNTDTVQVAVNAIPAVIALKTATRNTTLAASQKTLLAQLLDRAIQRIGEGRPDAAISQLQSYITYVQRFRNAGYISSASAQNLINSANAIIAGLTP